MGDQPPPTGNIETVVVGCLTFNALMADHTLKYFSVNVDESGLICVGSVHAVMRPRSADQLHTSVSGSISLSSVPLSSSTNVRSAHSLSDCVCYLKTLAVFKTLSVA